MSYPWAKTLLDVDPLNQWYHPKFALMRRARLAATLQLSIPKLEEVEVPEMPMNVVFDSTGFKVNLPAPPQLSAPLAKNPQGAVSHFAKEREAALRAVEEEEWAQEAAAMRFDGEVAIVTGAGAGLGREFARHAFLK